MKKCSRLITASHLLIIIVLGGFLIVTLKKFLIPLALAGLLALLLYPISRWLEQHKVPSLPSNLGLIFSSVILFISALVGFSAILRSFLKDLPMMRQQVEHNLTSLFITIEENFQIPIADQQAWVDNNLSGGNLLNTEVVSSIFSETTNIIYVFSFTFVAAFFFLHYRKKFKQFIQMLVTKSQHKTLHDIFDKMDEVAPHYMLGMLLIVAILIPINSFGFQLIGLDHAMFLGVLASLLNLIPFIGTIFGFFLVLVITLATQSSTLALGVLIMFVIVQFLDNNILTPYIAASRIALNPFMAILAIIFSSFIWGVMGMVVVLPFLAIFKIICDNIPELKPIGFILGNEQHIADKKAKHKQTTQKLLE